MNSTTEWHAQKPIYRARIIDGFVITECKRHKGGWLCKIDGNFKFPVYGKLAAIIKKMAKKKGEVAETAAPLEETAVSKQKS